MPPSDRDPGFDPTARPDATRPVAPRSPRVLPPGELATGTLVAGRYRVLRVLGRGGMGEVYEAEDLALDHRIALKFLPLGTTDDPTYAARLREEVRLSREVTHPNVCRVHDIVQSDGRLFLTMELVEGEDLASLLRRIGRMPEEKALDIAHQLCAGLHAAHRRGIVHRDLKPANVMVDRRGRVKIMDFGLAVATDAVRPDRIAEGTPAYMSPEQESGAAVDERSDIFAVGLVVFELLTGRRVRRDDGAFDLATSHALDPVVERVVRRCLERDPDDRFRSVLEVAAALPGGDPIGAALAIGELPSPEAVAAARTEGSLRPRIAYGSLAAFAGLLLVIAFVHPFTWLIGRMPPPEHPAALAADASTALDHTGHAPLAFDRTYRLELDTGYAHELRRHLADADLGTRRLESPFRLVYRQQTTTMMPTYDLDVTVDNPPFVGSGRAWVEVNADGELRSLRVLPEPGSEPGPSQVDWSIPFEDAGLSYAAAVPIPPTETPPVFGDARFAWLVGVEDGPPTVVRAATLDGRVVWMDVRPDPVVPATPLDAPNEWIELAEAGALVVALPLLLVLFGGAVLLPILSWKSGRSDAKGALRTALIVVALGWASSVLSGHLGPNPVSAISLCLRALPQVLGMGAAVWLTYVAVEPFARRSWPRAMVSWTRLTRGQWRDPLVARDVLLGSLAAAIAFTIHQLLRLAGAGVFLGAGDILVLGAPEALTSPSSLLGELLAAATGALLLACLYFGGLLVLRAVLRRDWAVLVVATVFVVLLRIALRDAVSGALLLAVAYVGAVYLVSTRAGFMGVVAFATVVTTLNRIPITLEFGRWYASYGVFTAAVLLGVALAATRGALNLGRGPYDDARPRA